MVEVTTCAGALVELDGDDVVGEVEGVVGDDVGDVALTGVIWASAD